jgi:Smg protein
MTENSLKERVLAIVSIIAHYISEDGQLPTNGDLVEELLAAGFEAEEIDAAFHWMESLSLHESGEQPIRPLTLPSHRIFTSEECQALSCEARGFLLRVREMGIVDGELLEEIIQKAMQATEDEVSLREMKTLTALTLFSRSHHEWLREVDCFMDDDWARLYH